MDNSLTILARAIMAELLTNYLKRPGMYSFNDEEVVKLGGDPQFLWPAVQVLRGQGLVVLEGTGPGYILSPTPLALSNTTEVADLARVIMAELRTDYLKRPGMYSFDDEEVVKLGGDPQFLWPAVQVLRWQGLVILEGTGPGYILSPTPLALSD